ncbi:MAG: hypothetical protein JWN34_2849 [Bryobacterales bacterium]|nr:hypothetical protein [Bryobacterales bacterium]
MKPSPNRFADLEAGSRRFMDHLETEQPGAADLEDLLRERAALDYRHACEVLEIGARHLRRLVELGELERIGRGHFKRITAKSIRVYRGHEEKRL